MKRKVLIFVLLLLVASAIGLYFYMYKDHRDISSEKAQYVVAVDDLQSQFVSDASAATAKYLDETLLVSGAVTSIDTTAHAIVLNGKLSAVLSDTLLENISLGKPVKIKGRFLGYDDLLEELKLDEATLVN